MTDDLIAFVEARLAEDDLIALAAREGPWAVRADSIGNKEIYSVTREERIGGDSNVFPDTWHEGSTAHAVRHDPSRVLRDVETSRWILKQHAHYRFPANTADWNEADFRGNTPAFPGTDQPYVGCKECNWDCRYEEVYPSTWCGYVLRLASAYSDHPGFRSEWLIEENTDG